MRHPMHVTQTCRMFTAVVSEPMHGWVLTCRSTSALVADSARSNCRWGTDAPLCNTDKV